jgi:hypothetical protein
MQDEYSPHFICPVCRARCTEEEIGEGLAVRRGAEVCRARCTEEEIGEGLAVRRGAEVYCLDHFYQAFPYECVNHPGTPGTGVCTGCGHTVCDDCTIAIAHHRICAACKQHWLERMEAGKTLPLFRVSTGGSTLVIKISGRITHALLISIAALALIALVVTITYLSKSGRSLPFYFFLLVGLINLAYIYRNIRFLNETIIFNPKAIIRKRGVGPFKTKKMNTSDTEAFILRPAGPMHRREVVQDFYTNIRDRLFLFATSEEVPADQMIMKKLSFWTSVRETFFFFKKPKHLLLAIQASEEELRYLQTILTQHLKRLKSAAGEQSQG